MTTLSTPSAVSHALLRRVRVPRDLDAVTSIGPEDDPDSAGLSPGIVEGIWRAAVELYRTGAHPAVQLCLRRGGRVVLNRSIGHARGNGPGERDASARVLATTGTPFCVYSASKAWTATIVLMLVEQGVFGLDERITDFLPAYGAHGKQDTTIAHALTHRAGIPYLPVANADLDRIDDRDFIRDTLCAMRPIGPPGSRLAYHALTGGYLLGEVVRTATGKGIGEVLREQVLDPLDFRWSGYGVAAEDVGQVGLSSFTGLPVLPPVSTQLERTLSGSLQSAVTSSNDPRFLTAVVPSANVVTTAFEMSRFYELLRRGGELDGVRVLAPQTMRLAVTQTAHLEPDRTLGWFPVRYGYGYMLGARYLSLYGMHTEGAFGHLGLSNVIGWADPARALSAGLITSGKAVLYPGIDRFLRLTNRIASRVPTVGAGDAFF